MADITHGAWIKDGTPVDKVFSNGSQVYGRNLFRGYPTNSKMRINQDNNYYYDYPFKYYGTRILLKPNTEYTVTWNYEVISGGMDSTELISVGRGNEQKDYTIDVKTVAISAKKITIKTPADVSDNPYFALRFSRTMVPTTSVIDYWDIAIREGDTNLGWTPALEDISDYSRNLLTGTGNHTVTGTNAQGYLSNETVNDLLTLFKGLAGQTVTVSVDYEYSGFVAGSSQNRLGWETHIFAGSAPYFGLWHFPKNDSGSGRISLTFVVPNDIIAVTGSMGYIQFSGSGTGTLSHLKLERGSVATPWTPAPEDTSN